MRRRDGFEIWSIALAVVISLSAGAANAQERAPRAIAMLPFADYTGNPEAASVMLPAIERAFSEAGLAMIFPDGLRPILRKYRIRAVGMIDAAGGELIARESGSAFLLTGSIDFFDSGTMPVAGFSLRLLDTAGTRPVYAQSVCGSGDQFVGLFALGFVESVDSLAYRLAYRAAEDIQHFLGTYSGVSDAPSSPVFAIVPFDGIERDDQAGAVASAYLLSRLIAEGVKVLEPGVSNAIFLRMGRAPRGEIDYGLVEALHDSLDVDLIITGAIDGFHIQPSGSARTRVEISIGARLIDARTGAIEDAAYIITDSESESGLLSISEKQHPAGEVMTDAINAIIDRLSIVSRQAVADFEQE